MLALPALNLSAARQFELSPWLRTQLENVATQDIDAVQGPTALAVAGIHPDLVFAKEAWPHTDPKWAGRVFFTMTIEGEMFEFGTLALPEGRRVSPGKVFCVKPLELHWLRPDPVVSTCWLALQWDVAEEQADEFALALGGAIESWNAPEFVLPKLGSH